MMFARNVLSVFFDWESSIILKIIWVKSNFHINLHYYERVFWSKKIHSIGKKIHLSIKEKSFKKYLIFQNKDLNLKFYQRSLIHFLCHKNWLSRKLDSVWSQFQVILESQFLDNITRYNSTSKVKQYIR